ncbi:MAG TPA: TetR/AcrR family transcriptional regulator [Ilumatobacteraceae bacterium]|nr:TetR/AcrR family transcriptional regulator [Ilumatobacteraceae bacterium]
MTQTERVVDGRTLRHQHRRPELLAAAVEYVLAHGVADLSLRPMAKALGVTHATLLRHFTSKEDLIAEVVSTIREGVFRPGTGQAGSPVALDDAMWAVWRRLCEPPERRQFALLFELVAANERDPGRFGDLTPMLITDFLEPLEAAMRRRGLSRRRARLLATGFLAQVRGLQLDLSVSGDRRRVDAAMRHYIDTMTAPDA